jgi:hypothetical protein
MAQTQGDALGMFRKKRTKPCKGETHAVKFQAQVLGRKATLLLRPYRACHCFMAQTQGDALGFHMAPRWGWGGVVRHAASARWGWGGVMRPRRLPVGAGKAWFVTRRLPVGAGKAWFVTRRLPVGAGEAWFIGRPLSFGLEVRHTGGTIYKFTRGCGVGFLTGRL